MKKYNVAEAVQCLQIVLKYKEEFSGEAGEGDPILLWNDLEEWFAEKEEQHAVREKKLADDDAWLAANPPVTLPDAPVVETPVMPPAENPL